MTLLQLACLGESNPHFPWENFHWDNKVYRIQNTIYTSSLKHVCLEHTHTLEYLFCDQLKLSRKHTLNTQTLLQSANNQKQQHSVTHSIITLCKCNMLTLCAALHSISHSWNWTKCLFSKQTSTFTISRGSNWPFFFPLKNPISLVAKKVTWTCRVHRRFMTEMWSTWIGEPN